MSATTGTPRVGVQPTVTKDVPSSDLSLQVPKVKRSFTAQLTQLQQQIEKFKLAIRTKKGYAEGLENRILKLETDTKTLAKQVKPTNPFAKVPQLSGQHRVTKF